MKPKAILIQSETIGRGDDILGAMLMANFLRLLGDSSEKPNMLIFWNAGIKLLCKGSKVIEHTKKLESQGIHILACTTCLEYFDLENKLVIGKPTTTSNSIQTMFDHVIVSL
jgi:selenium metabolism protein YedF